MSVRRQKSVDAYRAEVSCINRLRHEIVMLRHLVSTQQDSLLTLTATCEQLRREKYLIGSYTVSLIHILVFHLLTTQVGSTLSSPPLSPSITPSLFHSRLKTHLFLKSFPPSTLPQILTGLISQIPGRTVFLLLIGFVLVYR